MRTSRTWVRGGLSALAALTLLTEGCDLPPHPGWIGHVAPAEYCPGDTVVARYDFAAPYGCTSHSGLDCATLPPTIVTRSTPESFPAQTVTAFAHEIRFVPTAETVDVSFGYADGSAQQRIVVPYIDSSGTRRIKAMPIRANTARTTRIDGSGTYDLVFPGLCNGPRPSHAPTELPGPPRFSERLQAGRLCNPTTAPLEVDVGGTRMMLAPGACQDLASPASGIAIPAGAPVTLLSAPVDPAARCSSTYGTPPADIRLQVTMTCG